ncbi:MAG: hypothetical protein IT184_14140 [Acidobacteria bacterium]|nr:hypothetical protein [Acidobacteriota bacterium]
MTIVSTMTDALLTRAGVSPAQWRQLMALFRMLGERREMLGSLATDPHALRLTTYMLVLPGALLPLIAFGGGTLASYDLITLSITSIMLVLLLVPEALNSFLNPAEVIVLAPQPIDGRTYFAAKFAYLVELVIRAQTALNGPAALAGLVKAEARWFYPMTHLAAAYVGGIVLALIACATLGVLFRIVPASRLRSVGLWMQVVATLLPVGANLAQRTLRRWSAALGAALPLEDWSFSPLVWFHAIAMAGHGPSPVSMGWPLAIGVGGVLVFVGFGIRSLSAGYLSRIVAVMRTSSRRRGPMRRAVAAAWRHLPCVPATKAGMAFVLRMMRRDWQFRRAAAPLVLVAFMFVPTVVMSGRQGSPFVPAGFRVAGLLPEIVSLCSLMVCMVVAFSDHFRASWVFATAPAPALLAFARGIYWALWLPCVAMPLVGSGVYFARDWGPIDAALFTAYGLAVASLLLALQIFLVEALPFGAAPKAERPLMMLPFLVFGPVVFGVGWALQSGIYRSRLVTVLAALLIGLVAAAAKRASSEHLARVIRSSVDHVTTGA